eukprot:gnl/TRDRNA2_/TRDRNA2_68475_c0_seq1.p1 gnl/TRDRNA2_/TRDRNA2_68475_c0~~gnl/TRDRNA2_/TRDRNA2_68475_c0_seq1.p1  ORF type:complete len:399 (+),score=68.38 gnl/TRDRNA2_/TRDRNA2_68475_c0_seq1:167-1363(+)
MIHYNKGYAGLALVFRLVGTTWPHGIVPGMLSASIGLVLSLLEDVNEVISDEDRFVKNPYPFQLFAYLVGFVLVFRTNFGYQRYWEALDAVQRMGAKWLDGACMAIAFDAPGDLSQPMLRSSVKPPPDGGAGASAENKPAGVDHSVFFIEVVHLFSMMHALALQHLRWDPDLGNLEQDSDKAAPRMTRIGIAPQSSAQMSKKMLTTFSMKDVSELNATMKLKVLGKITDEELEMLWHAPNGEELATMARVTMVECWIMRRLIARQKFEPMGDSGKTSPPILSRLYQVISDGHLGFSQACKAAEVPFPFPYQNIIKIFLWMFTLTAPFVINSKILNVPARFVVNFIAIWAYFALAEVGDNLEDPYLAYDPNELPLSAIQHSFNARLLSFGVVPEYGERD